MAKKNRKWPFRVGDRVVTRIDSEAYYSDWNGSPKVVIPKGTIGTVGAVDVPPVTMAHNATTEPPNFNCVDFVVPGVHHGRADVPNAYVWRCSLRNNEIKLVD